MVPTILPMSDDHAIDLEYVQMALRDQHFFGFIVNRYEAKLDRYIARLGVHNLEDRQDVLQEIFIKVYRNLNGFDQSLRFSSWIYRIAHNEAISWYRKKSVRPEGYLIADSDELLQFVSTKETTSDVLFDQEVNAKQLTEGLEAIGEKYRTVLILRYFEHKEYSEISDILQIPTGSVGTLVHRGKQALKNVLNPEKLRT